MTAKDKAVVAAKELTPMQMLDKMIVAKVDPDALGKMMDLADRHQDKQAKWALNDALSNFRARCPAIEKNKGVPDKSGRIKYRYAPLDHIQQIIDPLLDGCGLAIMFDTIRTDGTDYAVCRVTHVDGASIEARHPIDMPDIPHATQSQKRGGGVTFARRYALIGALNLPIVGEDMNTEPETPISDSQLADLQALMLEIAEFEKLDKVGQSELVKTILELGGVDKLGQFPAGKFNVVCRELRNRAKQ